MTIHHHHAGSEAYAAEVFAGASSASERLRLQVARIAPHFRMALLTGERGVGKQTVAREMHRLSPAARDPLLALSCAEFVDRPRMLAHRGTLFLSGLDLLRPEAQKRLFHSLKALDRETRVIYASGSDLKGMVSTGRIRPDLYELSGTLEIRVAPLRERMDDFNLLVETMLSRIVPRASCGPSTLEHMRGHTWPGNLAELWTLLEKLAPLGVIEASDLPRLEPPAPPIPVRLDEVMHRHVMDVLQGCSGNKLRAAELLGISRSTLYRMLESSTPQQS